MQVDEPYLQARLDAAREYGLATLDRALDGVQGTTAVHICSSYAAITHERPSGSSSLPELADSPVHQVSMGPPGPASSRACWPRCRTRP